MRRGRCSPWTVLPSPGFAGEGGEFNTPRAFSIHRDAAQAVGKIAVDFHALGVTALTVSAHKFGGPPGVGALLLRRGAQLRPLFYGGHQQHGRRPGTEPVALAAGLAAALEVAVRDREANTARV